MEAIGEKAENGAINWEDLFPRKFLRVLLVEADDSTRHVVAVLLRKCGYRVTAVSDGLRAWEVLKERPLNVDLILTEVDLPSISGYALLTLIMEHDVCKNIPVIMMSSQGGVNAVYKCMMRGAADYLVKPIRRNELRNLWQHVWRRRACLVGGAIDGAGDAEETSDKAPARCKDSDALSSCASLETGDKEPELSSMVNDREATEMYSFAIMESNSDSKNERKRNNESGDYTSTSNHESSSLLELSLRGALFNDAEKKIDEGKSLLKHSSGSAFTRYKSKPVFDDGHCPTRKTLSCLQQRVIPIQTATTVAVHKRSVVSPEANRLNIVNMEECSSFRIHNNEENGHISPTTDQSTNSNFCNGAVRRMNQVKDIKTANSIQSSERELALMKFRLKRKDRCFEKKVRYESRKKLAEQRPRVKGQFVRQHVTN